jgi:two-component system nitrogen regulation response regulator GlnG
MAPAQVIDRQDLPPELLASRAGGGAGGGVGLLRVDASGGGVQAAGGGLDVVGSPGPGLGGQGAMGGNGAGVAPVPSPAYTNGHGHGAVDAAWLGALEVVARRLLDTGVPDVWEQLSRQFEGQLIRTALGITRGRRIEAAQKLGIGRNTITRKIQELGLEE